MKYLKTILVISSIGILVSIILYQNIPKEKEAEIVHCQTCADADTTKQQNAPTSFTEAEQPRIQPMKIINRVVVFGNELDEFQSGTLSRSLDEWNDALPMSQVEIDTIIYYPYEVAVADLLNDANLLNRYIGSLSISDGFTTYIGSDYDGSTWGFASPNFEQDSTEILDPRKNYVVLSRESLSKGAIFLFLHELSHTCGNRHNGKIWGQLEALYYGCMNYGLYSWCIFENFEIDNINYAFHVRRKSWLLRASGLSHDDEIICK